MRLKVSLVSWKGAEEEEEKEEEREEEEAMAAVAETEIKADGKESRDGEKVDEEMELERIKRYSLVKVLVNLVRCFMISRYSSSSESSSSSSSPELDLLI